MTITEILNQYNVATAPDGHHHITHNRIQVDCPWCSSHSGKWRLGIVTDGSRAHCWSCGFHSVVDCLIELTNESYYKIKQLLGDLQYEKEEEKHRGQLVLPTGVGDLLPAHIAYIKKRKLDVDNLVNMWGVKGIGFQADLAWRLFIPIHYHGEVVSWTTRSISDDVEMRYITAKPEQEKLKAKDLLFGEDFAKHAIIIVEGQLDVFAIGAGAVAVSGVGLTPAQVARMTRFPIRAICFDTEIEAQKRAKKLCDALQPFPGKTVRVELETGKDAASADKKEIQKLRQYFLE